jgi:hypothetical protein
LLWFKTASSDIGLQTDLFFNGTMQAPKPRSDQCNAEENIEMRPTGELLAHDDELTWYGPARKDERLVAFGLRLNGGGAHQSKTIMLGEITELIRDGVTEAHEFRSKILDENILGKATSSGRESVLKNLSSLYGLAAVPLLTRAFLKLAKTDSKSLQSLALLIALARDPLLRDSALSVAESTAGTPIQWPTFAARFNALHPGRFSEKMVRSLSQNCASTWTQTGHLKGKDKQRTKVHPSAAAAALAALIATVCGLSGPTMLSSAWFRILDLNPDTAMDALRSAEVQGLARLRSAGDVIEISVRQQLATTLGIPELEYV